MRNMSGAAAIFRIDFKSVWEICGFFEEARGSLTDEGIVTAEDPSLTKTSLPILWPIDTFKIGLIGVWTQL